MTHDEIWKEIRQRFEEERRSIDESIFKLMIKRQDERQHTRGTSEEKLHWLISDEMAFLRERAEKYVGACCMVWDWTGRPRPASFYQAVFNHSLMPLFGERSNAIRRQTRGRAKALSTAQRGIAIQRFADEVGALAKRWNDTLRGLAGNPLEWPVYSTALPVGGPYPSLSSPEAVGPITSTQRKSGPERVHTKDFCRTIRAAKEEVVNEKGRVSLDGLLSIAQKLDSSPYKLPKKWLEETGRGELEKFNQLHDANQIDSWTKLVESGNSRLITAMRRLVSRYAADRRD